MLMFGRDFRMPIDIIYPTFQDSPNFTNYQQHYDTMNQIYEIALKSNIVRQQRAKGYYDKKIKNDTLHLDGKVLILNPRYRSNSLTYRWYGPGRVIQCKHPVYEIFFQDNKSWYLRNKQKRVSNEFPLFNNEYF